MTFLEYVVLFLSRSTFAKLECELRRQKIA